MTTAPVSTSPAKAIVAGLTGLATLIADACTLGLISGSARIWATLAATFVGAVLVNIVNVYMTTNAPVVPTVSPVAAVRVVPVDVSPPPPAPPGPAK